MRMTPLSLLSVLLVFVWISTLHAERLPPCPTTSPTNRDTDQVEFVAQVSDPITVDDTVIAALTIKNSGSAPLLVPEVNSRHRESDYTVELKRDGESAPKTELEQSFDRHSDFERFSFQTIRIEPGKTVEVPINISKLFLTNREGKYSLQIRRYVFSREHEGKVVEIRSNKVSFEISSKRH